MKSRLFQVGVILLGMLWLLCVAVGTSSLRVRLIDKRMQKYMDDIVVVSDKYNVSPELVESMVWYLSKGNKNCKVDDRVGLMLVPISSACSIEEAKVPATNLEGGVALFMSYAYRYEDLYTTIMCYETLDEETSVASVDNGDYSDMCENVTELSYELERLHNK